MARDKERRWFRKGADSALGAENIFKEHVEQILDEFLSMLFTIARMKIQRFDDKKTSWNTLLHCTWHVLKLCFFFYHWHYEQVSHRSSFPPPSSSSGRRTTVSPVKTRRAEGRTGTTSRPSGRGRTAASARTQPAVPRPAQQSQEKNKVKSQDQDDGGGAALLEPVWAARLLDPERSSSLYFVFLDRFGRDGEQWPGGIGPVLSGHPPTADWHQQSPTGSCWLAEYHHGAEFAQGQCNAPQLFRSLMLSNASNESLLNLSFGHGLSQFDYKYSSLSIY